MSRMRLSRTTTSLTDRDQSASKRKQYESVRTIVHWLKDKPCEDCGVSFPPCVMEFHHRDPSTKSFTIAKNLMRPWYRVVLEIAKCVLLCANCHRLREHA